MADDRSLQRWGVVVGAGAILAALGAATYLTPPEEPPAPASVVSAPEAAGPTSTPPTTASDAPKGDAAAPATAEPAQAAAPPPAATASSQNSSFLVAFQADHPMARAQQLAAAGRLADASEAARQTIRTRRDLRGLCFDRFTAGGAEVVLRACTAVPRAQRAAFERTWTQRLTAMAGIEYAEPNHTLYPEGEN